MRNVIRHDRGLNQRRVHQRATACIGVRVSPAVLIPRPETELVVERTLALLPADAKEMADLGTGSGAIALAVASERPSLQITGCRRLRRRAGNREAQCSAATARPRALRAR